MRVQGCLWDRWDEYKAGGGVLRVKQLSPSACHGGIRSSPDPIHTTCLSGTSAWLLAPSCLLHISLAQSNPATRHTH